MTIIEKYFVKGANLGGWLVLERWIQPVLFELHAPNATDEWTFSEQASNASEALQVHWSTFITEDHIRMLASVNGNHLRIPVGYWAFIQPDPGEPFVSTGQKAHLERILGYCDKYKIHAFIDLHGMPGSQNGEHHSGRITQIQFFNDYNMERSLNTVRAVVNWVNALDPTLKARVAGIQPVNEPHMENAAEVDRLKRFYTDAYGVINASPYKMAMIFHDGFQGLNSFSDFLDASANAVIDLHAYHAFPPNPNKTSIIENICDRQHNAEHFHLPIFYGEWSLSSGIPNDDYDWFRTMMDTQVYAYKNGGCGFAFWTLRNNAVAGSICPNRRQSRQSYICFEGIAWSLQTLIAANVVDANTFSDTVHQQCHPVGSSAVHAHNSVFLSIISLIVCFGMTKM